MTYSDQVGVEERYIRTRCMWRNDISEPGWCGGMTFPDQMYVCGGMTYPDQMDVEE
jgi:hypothetical protein